MAHPLGRSFRKPPKGKKIIRRKPQMRNLKKIVSLALALMMVLSLMVTASAATFGDDADITHKEAVDVMVAAGILSGDGNGNFNPTKALERSSAAKLIAYLMLQDSIDYVDQSATDFSDVPAAHWASGFIAYCAENDIVVGNGTGKFNPNGAVNGYSFAKMVLLAICNGDKDAMMELDPTAEWNYVTSEWKTAPFTGNYTLKVRLAIAELKKHGMDLLAGLEDISLNADLTREHAAQMVFNALSAGGNDNSILATVYHLTKVDYTNAGLDGYKWIYTDSTTQKTTDATEPVITDTYVESFASGTKLGDVMAALEITKDYDKKGLNYKNTKPDGETTKVLGQFVDSDVVIVPATNLDVYITAGGVYKFMYTTETLAQAKLGAEVKDEKSENYGLYAWTFGTATTYAAKDAYTKDAYYLVVIGDNDLVAEPKVVEIVEGKITSKGADYVRIDGVKYTFNTGVTVPALGETKVLYLATDGTVLACTNPNEAPVISTETLVYVLGFYTVDVPGVPAIAPVYNEYGEVVKDGTDAVPARKDRYVQYVTLDGEIETALFAKNTNATEWNRGSNGNTLRVIKIDSQTGIATFSVPTSDAIGASGITANGVKFTSGDNNYYYTDAEFVQITGTLSKATVSEGNLKAALANKSTAWAIYTGKGTNKTVTKIFYWTAPTSAPVADPDTFYDMFLANNSNSTDTGLIETVGADGKTGTKTVYFHEVYLSGTKTEIMTYEATINAGANSYQVDKYGVYVEIKGMTNTESGVVTNLYGTLATIGNGKVFEDYDISEVNVIDVSAKGNGTVDLGDTVTAVYTVDSKTGAKTIDVIYITVSAETAK